MLTAYDPGAERIAYLDADLITPPGEMTRLLAILEARDVTVVKGARVALLGLDPPGMPGLSSENFVEIWQDIAQSRLTFLNEPKMGLDLMRISLRLQSLSAP